MQLSIVIPLLNEEDSINELYDWIVSVMQSNPILYELILLMMAVQTVLGVKYKI